MSTISFSNDNRVVIDLPNGLKLVAEQNPDSEYGNEIYIGITTSDGTWLQDLAVVRNAYSIDDNLAVHWKPDRFEVLVCADKDDEDYTDKFSIGLRDVDEI